MNKEIIEQTEQDTEIRKDAVADTENVEKGLGKFKSEEELLKAYNNIEKEFTKRSQRLKELESKLSEKENTESVDWEKEVDALIEKYPISKNYLSALNEEISEDKQLVSNKNCLEIALLRTLAKNFRTAQDLSEDKDLLLQSVRNNKDVRDTIVEEYVASLSAPVVKTLGRGGEIPIAEPRRPKSVTDAGNMAVKILKDRG